jgi:hypothetical protein
MERWSGNAGVASRKRETRPAQVDAAMAEGAGSKKSS